MSKPRFPTQQMAAAGIIAAIYAALTLLLPIPQYGGIQFRVAEAMTVLPFLFPEAAEDMVNFQINALLDEFQRAKENGNRVNDDAQK